MKCMLTRFSVIVFVVLLGTTQSVAQLSGSYTIAPANPYTTLSAAITALNAQGVSASITINVPAGYTETAPAGGYLLGSAALCSGLNALSATKTLTIQKSGTGTNPLITAFTPGTGTADGIFKMAGVDYVTIDGIDLKENTSNNSATTYMEWGYALVKLNGSAPYDGCQNVTIRNCSIGLNIANTNVGIYSGHHIATSTTLLGTNAIPSDACSNLTAQGNTFTGCQRGINLIGINLNTAYNVNVRIIGNDFTCQSPSSSYTGYGVYSQYDSTILIDGNTFRTASGNAYGVTGVTMVDGLGNVSVTKNTMSLSCSGTTAVITGVQLAQNRAGNGLLKVLNNKFSDWKYASAAGATMRAVYLNNNLGAFDSMHVVNNLFENIDAGPSTGTLDMINCLAGASPYINVSNDTIRNIKKTGNSVAIQGIYLTASGTGPVVISNNLVKAITSQININAIFAQTLTATRTATVTNNLVDSCTITVGKNGTPYGIYVGAAGGNSEFAYNTVRNFKSDSNTSVYGLYSALSGFSTIHDNLVSNISNGGPGNVYGIYSGNTDTVFKNTVTNLSVVNGSLYGLSSGGGVPVIHSNNFNTFKVTGIGSIYGINFTSLNGKALIYNNFISGYSTAANYSNATGLYGMYLGISALADLSNHFPTYKVCHNTINITVPPTTGADLGATGVWFAVNNNKRLKVDLRNNIVNVGIVPQGNGFVSVLRRNGGQLGVLSDAVATTSNGNIYFAPLTTNSYIYSEGNRYDTLTNTYNLSNDIGFNTTCGQSLYKSFIKADGNSFIESNLIAGTLPNTFMPVGSSYAKSLGVTTDTPMVTVDYTGVARPASPDAGALQFTGVFADVVPPVITYTPIPVSVYCTSVAPTLTTNITDASKVNLAPGTRPRIYYKKATEPDAFGVYPADNVSTFNGWKYVEATGTEPNFTFNINYSLLASTVSVGDSIMYFVMAQDSVATSNIAMQSVALATGYCPLSVKLGAAAAPLLSSTVVNGYKILAPQFTVVARYDQMCMGGKTELKVSPSAGTIGVQWQHNNSTGSWANIPGATNSNYYTPALTGTDNYRITLFTCGSGRDSIVTPPVQLNVNAAPKLTSVTPGVHCGVGIATLQAATVQGNTLRWYNNLTSDTVLNTGISFTTPVLTESRDYYVAASGTAGGETVPSPATWAPTTALGWALIKDNGLTFVVYRDVTINSVKIYTSSTTPGAATARIVITDTNTHVASNGTLYNFTSTLNAAEHIVPVGITLTPGTYKMTSSMTGVNSMATSTGASFPYVAPSNALAIQGISTYNFFYEWAISTTCEGTRTKVSAIIDSVSASVDPIGPIEFCTGDSIRLHANRDTGHITYLWQKNSTNINTATDSLFTAKESGSYTVKVSNANCSATSDAVVVKVNPLPTPVIAPSGNQLTTGDYDIYEWSLNGTPIPAADTKTFTPVQDGDYTVTVTDTNGCSGTSPVYKIAVGIASIIDVKANITIYPNPNNGKFVIKGDIAQLEGRQFVYMEVVDVTGRLLQKENIVTDRHMQHEVVLPDGCRPGLYFVKMYLDETITVVPFVKQ